MGHSYVSKRTWLKLFLQVSEQMLFHGICTMPLNLMSFKLLSQTDGATFWDRLPIRTGWVCSPLRRACLCDCVTPRSSIEMTRGQWNSRHWPSRGHSCLVRGQLTLTLLRNGAPVHVRHVLSYQSRGSGITRQSLPNKHSQAHVFHCAPHIKFTCALPVFTSKSWD